MWDLENKISKNLIFILIYKKINIYYTKDCTFISFYIILIFDNSISRKISSECQGKWMMLIKLTI